MGQIVSGGSRRSRRGKRESPLGQRRRGRNRWSWSAQTASAAHQHRVTGWCVASWTADL